MAVMAEGLYDAKWVEAFYDSYGTTEWDRMVRDPAHEVKLHVHRHFLERFVHSGDRVLEVGAGPGRFTLELAKLDAKVWVGDISPVQLDLHKQMAAAHGFEAAVCERRKADLCDLSPYASESFDAVVAYGGPLSYVFERRAEALSEVRRVLVPGGAALFSVMSTWGSIHEYLTPGVLAVDVEVNRKIVKSGDLHPSVYSEANHLCHMFRAGELADLLRDAGFEVEGVAASNCLSAAAGDRLAELRGDETRWNHLLEMELEACQEPGCVDMGTHIVAAGRKPTP